MSRRRIKYRQSGFCAACVVLGSIWSCHFSGAGEVVPVDGRFVSMKSSEEGYGPFLPASGVLLEEMPGNVRLAAEKFLGQLRAGSIEGMAARMSAGERNALHDSVSHVFDNAGEWQRIDPIEYRGNFAGRFVDARCCWPQHAMWIRLFIDPDSAEIEGVWAFEDVTLKAPLDPHSGWMCGKRIQEFLKQTYSLALDVQVVPETEAAVMESTADDFELWRRPPEWAPSRVLHPRGERNQDPSGRVWVRLGKNLPGYLTVDRKTPDGRYAVSHLSPGIYRVRFKVGDGSHEIVSDDIHLAGDQPSTQVELRLQRAASVTLTLVDSRTKRPLVYPDLRLHLAGWTGGRRIDDLDGATLREVMMAKEKNIENRWARMTATRYGTRVCEPFRREGDRYVIRSLPLGDYTLRFAPPMDCQWIGDEPRYQLAVNLSVDGPRQFVLSTDQLTQYVDSNFAWFDVVDTRHYRITSAEYSPGAVSLLSFSTKADAEELLCLFVWKGDEVLQLKAVRALARRQKWSEKALAAANYALACANAGMCSDEEAIGEAAIWILRTAEAGKTSTSDASAKLDANPAVRRLVADLGSKHSALRVYAARHLSDHGREAVPAIPYLRAALADKEYDFEPWNDNLSMYDFSTVAEAAKKTLEGLGVKPEP